MFDHSNMNWGAILTAALSSFMLGGLWYSPLMFLKVWETESKSPANTGEGGHHPALVYGCAFLLSLLASTAVAGFLGPDPTLSVALHHSLVIGIGCVGATFGINYLFSGYSLKLWGINGGYHMVQFTIFGLIFGLWP